MDEISNMNDTSSMEDITTIEIESFVRTWTFDSQGRLLDQQAWVNETGARVVAGQNEVQRINMARPEDSWAFPRGTSNNAPLLQNMLPEVIQTTPQVLGPVESEELNEVGETEVETQKTTGRKRAKIGSFLRKLARKLFRR